MKYFLKIFDLNYQLRIFFLGIKALLFGVCFIFFLLLIDDVWRKFSSNITTTGISYSVKDPSTEPYFTVCPLPGFWKHGPFFRRFEFFNNSFNLDDIFDPETVTSLNNESQYLVKEVLSLYFGRCYCIKILREGHLFVWGFKGLWDTKVYLHTKDEEFWLVLAYFPLEVSSVILDTTNNDGILSADLSFSTKRMKVLPRDKLPCTNYEGSDQTRFVECSKTALWSKLMNRINCSIAIFDAISGAAKTNFGECPNNDVAKMMENIFLRLFEEFRDRPESFGCPLPCIRVTYDIDTSYYHENTEDSRSNFTLYIFPGSKFTEDQSETLLYDAGGFLAAAGGHLGLLLGFSCLSALYAIVNWFKKFFN